MVYANTHENSANLLTKVLPMGEKQRVFVWMLQNQIFGSFPESNVVE